MLQINKITPQTVALHHDEFGFIGWVNQYELDDFRVQIMKEKAEGYYVVFKNNRLDITNKGRFNHWPDGFFDLTEHYLMQLT